MDQERRSQREMMQENEKQARTTYTNAQAKAAMSRRDNKASKLRVELTDPRKSNYFYEEALKTLRTNIQFAGADIKTILVTSCFPNEGKSDVVFQLAKEMGMAGKKTVLLDADIRKSVLVQRYLVDSDVKGLSQYLSGQHRCAIFYMEQIMKYGRDLCRTDGSESIRASEWQSICEVDDRIEAEI